MIHSSSEFNKPNLTKEEAQHISVFKEIAESCKKNMDVTELRYMGSTTVARDVDYMSKVLDGENSKM